MGLNEDQKKAAEHFASPCMVIAGPGSGKTFTLIRRIRNLIEKYQVKPENILVLTYTKAAAQSMQQRFLAERRSASQTVTFGTFHAICYQILKSQYHLPKNCLLSEKEKYIFLNPILKKLNILPDAGEQLLNCISLLKNGFLRAELPFPQGIDESVFSEIIFAYEEVLKKHEKIDFDDMVRKCHDLLSHHQIILEKWQKRFTFLLADEFQDCNVLQYEVLKLLAGEKRNLFVVGDDDQSIYGFRGAKPDIMKQFMVDFPDAKQIFLEANYRSHAEIIRAAGKVITENKNRFVKHIYAAGEKEDKTVNPVAIHSFPEKNEQYTYLTKRLDELTGRYPSNELAVIFRTNREIQDFLPFLDKKNIPYTVRGNVKIKYEHFTVQDLLAYLQLAMGNTERQTLLQVMNKPNREMERTWLQDIHFSWGKLKRTAHESGETKTAKQIEVFEKQCVQAGRMSPYPAINWIRKVMGYDKWLRTKAGINRELLEEWMVFLDGIQAEAGRFDTIADWISYVEHRIREKTVFGCDGEENSAKQRDGGIQIMTMHTSKGLEFSYVCIPNVNEGNIPHGRLPDAQTREEERRLFYVAMTRAKTALEILYLIGTKEHPRLPGLFLNELTEYGDNYSVTSSSNS